MNQFTKERDLIDEDVADALEGWVALEPPQEDPRGDREQSSFGAPLGLETNRIAHRLAFADARCHSVCCLFDQQRETKIDV